MLKGLGIRRLERHFDERGTFAEIMRIDWKDVFSEDPVQANLSVSFPGIVRAWHRHERGQIDCFVCVNGAVKICAYEDETRELDEIIVHGEDPTIVRIPGKYWHGFRVVGEKSAWILYFVNRLYDKRNPDEERRPWNDPTIVPRIINGDAKDPRIGKSWDWYCAPHG